MVLLAGDFKRALRVLTHRTWMKAGSRCIVPRGPAEVVIRLCRREDDDGGWDEEGMKEMYREDVDINGE